MVVLDFLIRHSYIEPDTGLWLSTKCSLSKSVIKSVDNISLFFKEVLYWLYAFHFRAMLSGICGRTPSNFIVWSWGLRLLSEAKTLHSFIIYIYPSKCPNRSQPKCCALSNIHPESTNPGNWRTKQGTERSGSHEDGWSQWVKKIQQACIDLKVLYDLWELTKCVHACSLCSSDQFVLYTDTVVLMLHCSYTKDNSGNCIK